MLYIENTFENPAMSLAAEEYALEHLTEGEYLMLWKSPPSVIVGKFQNAYGEVSLYRCKNRGIGIYRRNSGGGTVYHDMGNLNFSFFASRGENTDYPRFLMPVVNILRRMGADAEMGESFDIVIDGCKISGNAQSVHKNRVMHHGTLLFDADLTALNEITGHAREKVSSRSIASNPSPVCNIKKYLPHMSMDEFEGMLKNSLSDGTYRFTEDELFEISRIADTKYSTWDWNMAKSPTFTLKGENITLTAVHGVITECSYPSLVGERLVYEELEGKLDVVLLRDIFD